MAIDSKFLKRYSKAKRKAPAYSRALRHIRRVVQRSMFSAGPSPLVARETKREEAVRLLWRVSLRTRKVWRAEDRMDQGMISSRLQFGKSVA